jgi:hypothetical protein
MQKLAHCLAAAVMVITAGLLFQVPCSSISQADERSNAAYRDGAYLGQLAATRRESPRSMTSRWSSPEDRASFAAGYESAYRSAAVARPEFANGSDAAYRDGIFMGRLQAKEGRTARVMTSRWAAEKDRTSFAAGYSEAYGATMAERQNRENSSETMLLTPATTR